MSDYDNTNTGVLFRNEYKQKPKQPDYTGSANINGDDYKIAAWKNTSKAGKSFLSLKYTLAEDTKPTMTGIVDIDDSIDF
jgi:hypothetical protein